MRGGEDVEMMVRWEVLRGRMRARRLELGYTQTEVSRAMGLSDDYVSQLENGIRGRVPNLVTLWRWADVLGGGVEVRWNE